MLRRTRAVTEEMTIMKTSLIKPFEVLPTRRAPEESCLVGAALFASGRLVEVDEQGVYGLILAGFDGIEFGDDGTFTAKVATELPLERWDGVRRLETFVNDAVQAVNPAYVAEYMSLIEKEEAAVCLRAYYKRLSGEAFTPAEIY